jgi:hypothetical protein
MPSLGRRKRSRRGKRFFFEKKNQKTFAKLGGGRHDRDLHFSRLGFWQRLSL